MGAAKGAEHPSLYALGVSQMFEERFPQLARALKRDGFEIANGELRRTLPEALDLPATDDEVHTLLREFGLTVPMGHLDQAIQNHAQGHWAAANAQLRTCRPPPSS